MMTYERPCLEHLESGDALYCEDGSVTAFTTGTPTYGCKNGGDLAGDEWKACTDGGINNRGEQDQYILWCKDGAGITGECNAFGSSISCMMFGGTFLTRAKSMNNACAGGGNQG